MSLFHSELFFFIILTSMVLHLSKTDATEIKTVSDQFNVICKQTQDYNFCMTVLLSDPRAANVDTFYKLAILSLSITISQIDDSTNKIVQIANSLSGENGVAKQRIEICLSDYKDALEKFQGAFKSMDKSYMDVINWVREGTTKVIDCGNNYRKDPITECPMDDDNIKVFKLSEIIFLLLDYLLPH